MREDYSDQKFVYVLFDSSIYIFIYVTYVYYNKFH